MLTSLSAGKDIVMRKPCLFGSGSYLLAATATLLGPLVAAELSFPPRLPDGKKVATDTSEAFLKPPATLGEGVEIARTPPSVDFLYYPEQTYPGNPWSVWGEGLAEVLEVPG